MGDYLKQRALELLAENGQELKEPHHIEKLHTKGYDIIIVDAEGAYHFFLKSKTGELVYDGWDKGFQIPIETIDN